MLRLKFYNTLSRVVETFTPIKPDSVSVYTCGPTVYHDAHIGNLRTYIFEDVLTRLLRKAGYNVLHTMNITDVGHLQSDADVGDDKMVIASAREQKTPWEIAKFYEEAFLRDCEQLGIVKPTVISRATEHIPQIIDLISKIELKGYSYKINNNVYFDVSKFATYGDLGRLATCAETPRESRVDIDLLKKDQRDFVLWFSESKYPNQVMKWDSPWGIGFPGWHVECSAMAMYYLGETVDIHCGGIDHIPVHHTNEIAQAESVLGKKWVNYWMHGEFLNVDSAKMSKSTGGFLTLTKLIEAGYEPIHYRFFCLNAHYRSNLNFSFDLLEASRKDFESIKCKVISLQYETAPANVDLEEQASKIESYQREFWHAISNDINTNAGMRVFRNVIRDTLLTPDNKRSLLIEFDMIFGLGVNEFVCYQLTDAQRDLLAQRSEARRLRDWSTSDRIRDEFKAQGILLNDERDGSVQWYKTRIPKTEHDLIPIAVSSSEVTSTSATTTATTAAIAIERATTTSSTNSSKFFKGRVDLSTRPAHNAAISSSSDSATTTAATAATAIERATTTSSTNSSKFFRGRVDLSTRPAHNAAISSSWDDATFTNLGTAMGGPIL